MDKPLLSELETTAKALKGAIARSQNGIAGLKNISKLGSTAMGASSPIFDELKQLESEAQTLLKTYRDLLGKAAAAGLAAGVIVRAPSGSGVAHTSVDDPLIMPLAGRTHNKLTKPSSSFDSAKPVMSATTWADHTSFRPGLNYPHASSTQPITPEPEGD